MQVSSQGQRNHHSKSPTTTGMQYSGVYLYYLVCKILFKQPQEAFLIVKKNPQTTNKYDFLSIKHISYFIVAGLIGFPASLH